MPPDTISRPASRLTDQDRKMIIEILKMLTFSQRKLRELLDR
jgi:hypothetical protein